MWICNKLLLVGLGFFSPLFVAVTWYDVLSRTIQAGVKSSILPQVSSLQYCLIEMLLQGEYFLSSFSVTYFVTFFTETKQNNCNTHVF